MARMAGHHQIMDLTHIDQVNQKHRVWATEMQKASTPQKVERRKKRTGHSRPGQTQANQQPTYAPEVKSPGDLLKSNTALDRVGTQSLVPPKLHHVPYGGWGIKSQNPCLLGQYTLWFILHGSVHKTPTCDFSKELRRSLQTSRTKKRQIYFWIIRIFLGWTEQKDIGSFLSPLPA